MGSTISSPSTWIASRAPHDTSAYGRKSLRPVPPPGERRQRWRPERQSPWPWGNSGRRRGEMFARRYDSEANAWCEFPADSDCHHALSANVISCRTLLFPPVPTLFLRKYHPKWSNGLKMPLEEVDRMPEILHLCSCHSPHTSWILFVYGCANSSAR